MKNKNGNVLPKKMGYVKPTVVKHVAATLLVGSSPQCGSYVSSTYCPDAPYYH